MAQASKNQATASKTAKSAKPAAAPAVVEEVLEDEDVLDVDDVEPDMSSTEAASDEKPESNINEDGEEQDERFEDGVEAILEVGQASVSMLQRRLKLGYARAARIVDELEEKGIVGPFEGSKPRKVLITKQQWMEMNALSAQSVPSDDNEEEITVQ